MQLEHFCAKAVCVYNHTVGIDVSYIMSWANFECYTNVSIFYPSLKFNNFHA